jgi:hypothetical protein
MNKFKGLLPALLCFAASGFAQIEFDGLDSDEGSLRAVETKNGRQLLGQLSSFCECEDFETGSNENWPHVVTACLLSDGNMGESQTFEINVTSLPEEGATYRVAKTVANGNWDVSNATPLELGVNVKTVGAVAFARSLKFQFSDCTIEYTLFTVNEEGICGSQPLILGCTDMNACNFNPNATDDDESCVSIGDECDDNDALTVGDVIDENCDCVGQGDPAGLEYLDLGFQMGPNPASQTVFISASTAIQQVIVLNASGVKILQEASMSSSLELDFQGIPDGIYLVKCYIGDGWMTRKIVVANRG